MLPLVMARGWAVWPTLLCSAWVSAVTIAPAWSLRPPALLPPAPLSLADSSGVFLGPEYHFDLVRPGAALYGVAPNRESPSPLQAVVGLRAHILQMRTLSPGDRVGYGLTWQVSAPRRVATIAAGYADGQARHVAGDRTSTRLNSSYDQMSTAVFCLLKKMCVR